uniref:Uncharacterized protein n=1 Tax=Brassica oleracea var. oleracea TaxID=109376 RepID=A0A0D3AWT5_BRAOL
MVRRNFPTTFRRHSDKKCNRCSRRKFVGIFRRISDDIPINSKVVGIPSVCYISYPWVAYGNDPWVTVTQINPRGRVDGTSDDDEPLQPESTSNAQAVEDLENVQLVENLTVFGHDAVVHSEPEAEQEFNWHSDFTETVRMYVHNLGACSMSAKEDELIEANDGNPVDRLQLIKVAHTNKTTGQIQDPVIRGVVDLVEAEIVSQSQPLSDDGDSTGASTNLSLLQINEMVEKNNVSRYPSESRRKF